MADKEVKFMRAETGETNLADDPKMRLLATCILSQHAAGFKTKGHDLADLRQGDCPECGAPGFNTGWGYWMHTCGAEVMPEGELSAPCNAKAA